MKRCTKCHVVKPLEEFPKRSDRPSGRYPACRECKKASKRHYYLAHHDEMLAKAHARYQRVLPVATPTITQPRPGYKICLHCAEEKPLSAFEKGTTRNKQGYTAPRCKRCRNFSPPPKTPRTIKRCTRCKERKSIQCFIMLRHSNGRRYPSPQCTPCNTHRKKARKGVKRATIIARDRSRCGICGKKVSPQEMSIDHIIPLSAGGTHAAINLQVAHKRCNSRRGAGRIPAQMRLF